MGNFITDLYGNLGRNIATAGQALGLPEMNISERLSGSTNQNQPYYTFNRDVPNYASTGQTLGASTSGPMSSYNMSYAPTNTLSGGGGGGGGSSSSNQDPHINPTTGVWDDNYFASQRSSAEDQARIELESALNEFDRSAAQAQNQLTGLEQDRTRSLGTIDTEYGRAQKESTRAKEEATTTTKGQQAKALSTAQDVQKSNRNVLRALGILSSTAAGEMLSKPMNEFQSQYSELQTGLVKRLNQVEDWWGQRQADFTNAKTSIEQQFANLKANIETDLRFNERQRITAVKAANAALSQRLAEIQQQAVAYQNAAKQYSDNMLMQIAQIQMYQNPTADTSKILSTLMARAQEGYQPQQVGVQQTEEQRKKLLSGLG